MTQSAPYRLYDGTMKLCFILLFTLVPLLLTPWNYELFEYNKMMAVYVLTAIITCSWLVKSIHQRQFRLARTPLDIPIWVFTASQLVSALFSIDPHVSWLGYYSRFNGGMWSIISYVLLYYAFLSNLDAFESNQAENKKSTLSLASLSPLLNGALLSGAIVALYGVLERLGIDKHIWVQDVQNRVFSTLGQPNWLAAYLVMLIPLAMWGAIQIKKKPVIKPFEDMQWHAIGNPFFANRFWHNSFILLFIYHNIFAIFSIPVVIVFFTVLLFTRSRSGLLGFAAADIIFWGLIWIGLLRNHNGIKLFVQSIAKRALILHVIFALIVFINGTGTPALDRYVTFSGLKTIITKTTKETPATQETTQKPTGPALEVGGTESGKIREYVWHGAINAWKSTKKTMLIGTGVETFAFAFYQFRPAGHNLTSEWDFLYNKAHNEYLNYLATTGILGLGSYLLFVGTFIYWFLKQIRSTKHEARNISDFDIRISNSLPIALFAGWVSILITNFFGFSVVVVQLGLFLFPAFIFSLSQDIRLSTKRLTLPIWFSWIAIAVGIYVVVHISNFWYADKLFTTGYHAIRSGNAGAATQSIREAIRINKNEPLYHDELAAAYATLSVAAFEAKNATQASELAGLALGESTRALSISPNNVNYWKTRTKVYYTLSALDPALNIQAIEALKQGLTLSPNDAKIYYNLAILTGRTGDTDTAIAHLEQAKKLKNNYRDVYFALHVFYTERKQTDQARAILSEYLNSVDPNDKEFLEKVK